MLLRAWATTLSLAVVLVVLGEVGGRQRGPCVPSDPIPDCPEAYGLGEWTYAIFGALLLVLLVWGVLTLALVAREILRLRRS